MTDERPWMLRLLAFCLERYAGRLSVLELGTVLRSVRRQNDKRPALLEVYIPDEWTVNLKGNEKLRDTWLLIRVPRDVAERAASPIILPSESL